MLHGVGAVVSFRSQQGIGLLEGRVVTVRLFVVLPRLPFTSTRVSVLGDLFNAFACVLQCSNLHEGVRDWQRLTLY